MWNSIRQALTLGPRFRSHARKPGLEVYFDPTSTYERRDVADTGDRPGYFCHVMVRNDGPVAARNCRGRLLEIQVRGADGRTSPAPGFFAPVFLKWAREPDFDAREVEGNQVRRLDLCFALASAPGSPSRSASRCAKAAASATYSCAAAPPGPRVTASRPAGETE